ncbi:bifunctional DNA primase/polymerase [Rugamonas aquatica]|nr:bifunctional DNA primase/polymerase [Rugamonas aquatica]
MIAEAIKLPPPLRAANPVLDYALAYAKRGWSVYPINGITDGKCDCGHDHPAVHNGAHPCSYFTHLTSTCDPAIILGWVEKWPNMNFAVATGRKQEGSDYVLVAVEVPADGLLGEEAMAQVAAKINGSFRTCGQVLTPNGTRHVYIEVTAEQDLNFGRIQNAKIHAKNGSVMGAGSLHQSGATYQWEGQSLPAVTVIAGSAHLSVTSKMTATAMVVNTSAAVRAEEQKPIEDDAIASYVPDAACTDFQAIGQDVTMRIAVNRAIAAEYMTAGFKLCRIATGTKGPKTKNWQDSPITLDQVTHEGLGLIHALSGTCAIDLDNFESAVAWFEARNIDLLALLAADDAVQIKSGQPNRGKLVYRLPRGIAPLEIVQVKNHDGSMLIEFRSASVKGCQDVLPPTIHPTTGKPYEWAGAGDFKNLPELPPAVLALWQSMLVTKAAMNSPAKPAAAPVGYRIPEGGRNNALFKLGGNMARLGLLPESIRAALNIENQHRCKQPLPENEVDRIAKSAATNSYGAKEAAGHMSDADFDNEALELAEKAVVEADMASNVIDSTVKVELPGVMRDIAAWSARTARTVQPAFEQCTALAACSSVLARDFIGSSGSHTNTYTIVVGPSGSGKENALSTVIKILDAYDPVRRAGKPASDTAVLTVMGRNPASTFVMDELGEVLQSVFAPSAASYQARIGTTFMDLYTKGGENYRGTEYGIQDSKKVNGRERTDLSSPCPSIFGATTAVTLFKGMSDDVIGSGFLPRILYFRAPDKIPMPNFDRANEPIPESVIAWLTAIKDRVEKHAQAIKEKGDLIGAATHRYQPIMVPYSAAAARLVRQAQLHIVDRRNACVDELESTMLTRTVENASRVALTLALATAPWAEEVDAEHFKAALAIVINATNAFMADIRSHLFGSKHAKIETLAYTQIVAHFKKHGKPITEGILVDRCKVYGAAALKDREQAMKALEGQGKVTIKNGRSRAYLPRG